jgi:hypothetical protein
MTFQVVMKASDGIILAGDKQTVLTDVVTPLTGRQYEIRWLALSTKIQVSLRDDAPRRTPHAHPII